MLDDDGDNAFDDLAAGLVLLLGIVFVTLVCVAAILFKVLF